MNLSFPPFSSPPRHKKPRMMMPSARKSTANSPREVSPVAAICVRRLYRSGGFTPPWRGELAATAHRTVASAFRPPPRWRLEGRRYRAVARTADSAVRGSAFRTIADLKTAGPRYLLPAGNSCSFALPYQREIQVLCCVVSHRFVATGSRQNDICSESSTKLR